MSRTRTALVSLSAVAALTLGLAACNAEDKTDAATNAGAASTPAKADDKKTDDKKPADKKDEPKGGTDKFAADLQAKLKSGTQGASVTEVRAKKSVSDYEVTVNTTLTPDDHDAGSKIAEEAQQWIQDNPAYKVSYIQVLDKDKNLIGNALNSGKDKNKEVADKFAANLQTALKATKNGSKVTEVRAAKQTSYTEDYEVTVNTTLASGTDSMDTGSAIAEEAKQWIQDHPDVKVSYIKVLDKEKGLIGNDLIG